MMGQRLCEAATRHMPFTKLYFLGNSVPASIGFPRGRLYGGGAQALQHLTLQL